MKRRVSSRGTTALLASFAVPAFLVVALSLFAPAQATAASPPQVAGATVLSSTSVKVTFSAPVARPSATSPANYGSRRRCR